MCFMRKQIILLVTLLILSLLAFLIGCGGGSSTSSGTVPVIVVTATPDSGTNNINRGYLREDYVVDWNATSTSTTGVAIFEGLTPSQSYNISSSLGTTLSNVIAQAGMVNSYYIYRTPGWSTNSYSGFTEFSGDVFETNKVTPIKNCNVKLISESTGQVFNTTTNSQGNYNFSGSFQLGYYTMIYSANNYKTWGIYHYPFRTDSLKYHMNLVRDDQWNSYLGSSHPYDANKGYLLISVMESEANINPISGVSVSIQSSQPVLPTATNTPVIINPTATPTISTQPTPSGTTPTPTKTDLSDQFAISADYYIEANTGTLIIQLYQKSTSNLSVKGFGIQKTDNQSFPFSGAILYKSTFNSPPADWTEQADLTKIQWNGFTALTKGNIYSFNIRYSTKPTMPQALKVTLTGSDAIIGILTVDIAQKTLTPTPTPGSFNITSSTTSGHTHNITINLSDLNGPPSSGKTYTSSTTDGHSHALTLTQAQLIDINNRNTVTVVSSNNNGHTHSFSIVNPNPVPTPTPPINVTVQ